MCAPPPPAFLAYTASNIENPTTNFRFFGRRQPCRLISPLEVYAVVARLCDTLWAPGIQSGIHPFSTFSHKSPLSSLVSLTLKGLHTLSSWATFGNLRLFVLELLVPDLYSRSTASRPRASHSLGFLPLVFWGALMTHFRLFAQSLLAAHPSSTSAPSPPSPPTLIGLHIIGSGGPTSDNFRLFAQRQVVLPHLLAAHPSSTSAPSPPSPPTLIGLHIIGSGGPTSDNFRLFAQRQVVLPHLLAAHPSSTSAPSPPSPPTLIGLHIIGSGGPTSDNFRLFAQRQVVLPHLLAAHPSSTSAPSPPSPPTLIGLHIMGGGPPRTISDFLHKGKSFFLTYSPPIPTRDIDLRELILTQFRPSEPRLLHSIPSILLNVCASPGWPRRPHYHRFGAASFHQSSTFALRLRLLHAFSKGALLILVFTLSGS
ncbi:hypothetical protein C8R47DRAFT_1329921 [Mycena vitilis]|nr:hypothetical protein C8R47DRAFT_1329921 [Mycena vitilis]